MGVWLLPWRWHILSILFITGRGISAETCGLDDMFPPYDLCSSPETLCYYIFNHTYAFLRRVLVIGRIYTYTGSVVQYWWRYTPSQSIGLVFGSARFLCWMPLVFFGFTNCVLLYDNKTDTRMPVTIGIRFKQHFDTRYFAFCNLSPPRVFCSWTFFQNIEVNMVRTIGPLYVTSRYSTRIFYGGLQALQLIGVVD